MQENKNDKIKDKESVRPLFIIDDHSFHGAYSMVFLIYYNLWIYLGEGDFPSP